MWALRDMDVVIKDRESDLLCIFIQSEMTGCCLVASWNKALPCVMFSLAARLSGRRVAFDEGSR